mgnify:FL=1
MATRRVAFGDTKIRVVLFHRQPPQTDADDVLGRCRAGGEAEIELKGVQRARKNNS